MKFLLSMYEALIVTYLNTCVYSNIKDARKKVANTGSCILTKIKWANFGPLAAKNKVQSCNMQNDCEVAEMPFSGMLKVFIILLHVQIGFLINRFFQKLQRFK